MSNEEMNEDFFPVMILVDEEGIEHQFELLGELEIEDETYRVLAPLPEEDEEYLADEEDDQDYEEEDEEELEVIILKVVEDEEGNEFMSDIEDDEEWEMVADAWQELLDNEEI